ncbi:N-6 DNA methylase [Helicobacter burdigaliensis]|uniref:N-6 DNA methylase n=1 Tax=Helicobacter burdigaliensis TaxID=2315334 RepID=UPI000EF6726E|nr:N-6 DNA methylase [Helicobacter burdigaliensis]
MKSLISIFNYIHRFYEDSLESLQVLMQLILLKEQSEILAHFLSKKEKYFSHNIYEFLKSNGIRPLDFTHNLNHKKIAREMLQSPTTLSCLQDFIQTLCVQKSILKLYEYATPLEVNELVYGLMELKKEESIYNPCCGLGSFLLFVNQKKFFKNFYGSEIHTTLIQIAKIIASLLKINPINLSNNDFLQIKPKKSFDKIFCYPPSLQNLFVKKYQNDPLLNKYEITQKSTLESLFIANCVEIFKQKCVFVISSKLLHKPAGAELKNLLLKNHLLEAIITIPKNLFFRQQEDFSLLVVSHNNHKVFFIDASNFYIKEGKYNRLVRVDEILDIYFSKQDSSFSRLLDYKQLSPHDLLPHTLIYTKKQSQNLLKNYLETSFRGHRISGDLDLINCYDFGIREFQNYGYTNSFGKSTLKPNSKKIDELCLKPNDIVLPLRGIYPKIAIIGKEAQGKKIIPNAGILVLRPKNEAIAKALYVYFNSKTGLNKLEELYKQEGIKQKELLEICLEEDFLKKEALFDKISQIGEVLKKEERKIKLLLGY